MGTLLTRVSIGAVVIFQKVCISILDEGAVIGADRRIHDADITFFNSSNGMKILIEFEGLSPQLLGQNCNFRKTSHLQLQSL
jgi:hypothetical protein